MAHQSEILNAAAVKTARAMPPAFTTRVLAVIDNDAQWRPVINRLCLAGPGSGMVVLLNIQPKPNEMQTRGLFKEAIRDRLIERGRQMLAPAGRALQEAGIPYTTRVELADELDAVIRCAHEQDCESIIVAMPPLTALRRCWVRKTGLAVSAASQLAELADLPVLVVHAEDR